MHLRRNALLGAARLIDRIEAIAQPAGQNGAATVGSMRIVPNSPNVVPGEVFLTVDLRHPQMQPLQRMEEALLVAVREACEPLKLEANAIKIWDQPPVVFDPDCVSAVRRGAEISGYTVRDIVSGASHDASYVSRVAPTAMIFVPCRGGISHNEAEYTSKEQCAAGAQTLLQAVLDYDRMLADRHATGAGARHG
jgi:N-carbamoyl-L-amino-acid hydrolase